MVLIIITWSGIVSMDTRLLGLFFDPDRALLWWKILTHHIIFSLSTLIPMGFFEFFLFSLSASNPMGFFGFFLFGLSASFPMGFFGFFLYPPTYSSVSPVFLHLGLESG